jgi:hypothetical protein
MEFPHESDAFTDHLCLDFNDHSAIFGSNRRSEPLRVQFSRGLWDVSGFASRHAEILAQS